MRTVAQLRGLTTIVDCLVRQKLGVNNLEEIQILSFDDKLVLATNTYASAATVCTALNQHARCEDFEKMMYLVYVVASRILTAADRIRASFQQRLQINAPYGGAPATWAEAWRGANTDAALAMEKLAKVVILRKMRRLQRFNVGFTEQMYKDQVIGYLGIDLNKANARAIGLAVLVAGTDDEGINLADEPVVGTEIPLQRYLNAGSASGVLTSPLDVQVYNADGYPYKTGGDYHAEQHLVTLLVDVARRDDVTHSANIGGKKVPCATCEPVLARFKTAYENAYDEVRFNEPGDDNGPQGGGAGGALRYTNANKNGNQRFDDFIDRWVAAG